MSTPRTSYPSDVSDEEWAFVAPYLDEASGRRVFFRNRRLAWMATERDIHRRVLLCPPRGHDS